MAAETLQQRVSAGQHLQILQLLMHIQLMAQEQVFLQAA
jgi:hypothetical protein